jgi:hypothetical protein
MPSTIPVVIHVRGEVIYKHTSAADTAPTIAGYRYTAVLADRSEVIIRGKSKRRYEWAYQWTVPIGEGKRRGLAAYFTYSSYRMQPSPALAELRIEWANTFIP